MLCLKIGKSLSANYFSIVFVLALFSFESISISSGFAANIPSSSPHEWVDATQMKVPQGGAPQRIVTLVPSLGELVSDVLGADLDRIVGVSEYSDYPPGLKKKASIGPYHQFNLEKVLALKPDLVLATLDGNPQDRVKHLRELGLQVVVVDTENFEKIADSMRIVSAAVGDPSTGEKMAELLIRGVDTVRLRSRSHPSLSVLLQVGDNPLVVVGKKSFLHTALETVGAKNTYGQADTHYPQPSLEDVFHHDPDIIIVMALGDDLGPYNIMKDKWMNFKKMKAVKNHRVFVLKCDAILRPTLRLLEGLSQLSQTIYGQLAHAKN